MKKVNRKTVVKKLDEVFSQYIRITKSDKDGMATCVSCGKVAPWKEMQCGHYFSRSKYPTRWDEDNCHIQCVGCNVFLKGNYPAYAKFMYDSYSKEFMDELQKKSLSIVKIPTIELQEMIDKYKQLVKEGKK